MQLFKGRLKFLTYTTVGLVYDIIGVAILTLIYNPVIANPYSSVGKFHVALFNPDRGLRNRSMWFIVLGFLFVLIDNLLNIYRDEIKDNLSKIIIRALLFFLFLGLIYFLIRIAYLSVKIIWFGY